MGTAHSIKRSAAPDSLLKPDAVARRLNVEKNTLAEWRCKAEKRQSLPFVKVGGAVRYRPEDVDRFIAENLCAA